MESEIWLILTHKSQWTQLSERYVGTVQSAVLGVFIPRKQAIGNKQILQIRPSWFFFNVYLFILRKRECGGGIERVGGEREPQTSSTLPTQSPTQGSMSQTGRS